MSDAVIKAALQLAGEAVRAKCDDRACCMNDLVCPFQPCTCTEAMAAAAIAEFLEALPPGLIRWGTDGAGYDPDNKPTLRQMAAAVRRAAGGGG